MFATSLLAATPAICLAQPAPASAPAPGTGIDYGVILDGAYTSSGLALPSRERGLALGHTEATVGGNINDMFAGRLTAAAEEHEGSVEFELEEAFIETRSLPAGLTLRAGRFFSQIGYLNEQHPHTDDFVERPLLYRAFLGEHYFDNGVRLNWVAPTPLYWRLGVEIFDGGRLSPATGNSRTVGAFALSTKVGGDLGIEHSWQVGVAYLRNRLDPAAGPDHEDDEHGDDEDEHGDEDDEHGDADEHGDEDGHAAGGDEHAHAHGARFFGRNLWVVDAVWKWAPDGNNRERQLRLSAEYARVTDLNDFATSSDFHEAWYLSAVYRFAPQWEAGVRYGELKVREPHGEHFDDGRLQETNLMLAWKRSHSSTLRVQWTTQRNRDGFPDAGDTLMLQYVMSLGGHRAHSF